jgi:hypothetical protein
MSEDADDWRVYGEGESIGEPGSEGGVILRDEEYRGAARITLERTGMFGGAAITCGLYGWMVHTRYFAHHAEAEREYQAMRGPLAKLAHSQPLQSDPDRAARMQALDEELGRFLERCP